MAKQQYQKKVNNSLLEMQHHALHGKAWQYTILTNSCKRFFENVKIPIKVSTCLDLLLLSRSNQQYVNKD